jgi:hypothetical protein
VLWGAVLRKDWLLHFPGLRLSLSTSFRLVCELPCELGRGCVLARGACRALHGCTQLLKPSGRSYWAFPRCDPSHPMCLCTDPLARAGEHLALLCVLRVFPRHLLNLDVASASAAVKACCLMAAGCGVRRLCRVIFELFRRPDGEWATISAMSSVLDRQEVVKRRLCARLPRG